MYERGEIYFWNDELVFLDKIIHHNTSSTLNVRKTKEGNELGLDKITIDLSNEKENLSFIGKMDNTDYIQYVTAAWHNRVPETQDFQVCSSDEATHVIFTETDLEMAGEDGEDFTPSKVYPVNRDVESGDLYIEDDKKQALMGFDLHIPCEYLKKADDYELNPRVHSGEASLKESELPANVISLSAYRAKRRD